MNFRETIAKLFRRRSTTHSKEAINEVIKEAEKAGVPPKIAVEAVRKEGVLIQTNVNAQKKMLQKEVEILKKETKESDAKFKNLEEIKKRIESAHELMHKAQTLVYELERIIYSRNESLRKTNPGGESRWVEGREITNYSLNVKSVYLNIVGVIGRMTELTMVVKKEELISEKIKNSILKNVHDFNALVKDYFYQGDRGVSDYDIEQIEQKIDNLLNKYSPKVYSWTRMTITGMRDAETKLAELRRECNRLKSNQIDFDEKDEKYGPLATPKFRENINKIADSIIELVEKAEKEFKAGIGRLSRVEELDKEILREAEHFHGDYMRSVQNFLNFDKEISTLEKELANT